MVALKVLTLNMNTGHGPDGRLREKIKREELLENLDRVATLIRDSEADVVCLQEVDIRWSGTRDINQAEHLRRTTGFEYVLYHTHHRSVIPSVIRSITNIPDNVVLNRDLGTAILSRRPLLETSHYDFGQNLTHNSFVNYFAHLLSESKGYTLIEIEIDGKKIGIMNVHLMSDIVYEILTYFGRQVRGEIFPRVWQVEKILEHIREYTKLKKLPLVVAGDFNTVPRESQLHFVGSNRGDPDDYRRDMATYLLRESKLIRTIPELFGQGTAATIAPYHTYPGIEPDRTLDYVFVTEHFDFVDYKVLPFPVSDHLAVLAAVRLM